jgi:hypothetical protein
MPPAISITKHGHPSPPLICTGTPCTLLARRRLQRNDCPPRKSSSNPPPPLLPTTSTVESNAAGTGTLRQKIMPYLLCEGYLRGGRSLYVRRAHAAENCRKGLPHVVIQEAGGVEAASHRTLTLDCEGWCHGLEQEYNDRTIGNSVVS